MCDTSSHTYRRSNDSYGSADDDWSSEVAVANANTYTVDNILPETSYDFRIRKICDSTTYSDWATTEIPADIKSMWYRLSRREDDYCIECSEDGVVFKQMRICHVWNGQQAVWLTTETSVRY